MSLVTAVLSYILNTGPKASQDNPTTFSGKVNAAFAGLLSNDVALSARMDAVDAAQGFLTSLAAPAQSPLQVYSAKSTPWTQAATIATAVSPANAVSPASGNPGRFVCYVPLVGTYTYASTTVKLFLAVYAQQSGGLYVQAVAVSAAGAVTTGAVLNVGNVYSTPGATYTLAGIEPSATTASAILRVASATIADITLSVNQSTLAVTSAAGTSKPTNTASFVVNFLAAFVGSLAPVGRPIGNGSMAHIGSYNGWPATLSTQRGVTSSPDYELDPLNSNLANLLTSMPSWTVFPSGLGVALHNAKDMGPQGVPGLVAALVTTSDRGVATVSRLKLSPVQGQAFQVDQVAVNVARLEFQVPNASGVLQRHATFVAAPTALPGGLKLAVSGRGILPVSGGAYLGVAMFDTLDAYVVTADGPNAIGIRREAIDGTFATTPNLSEGAAFGATIGTAYDTAGFTIAAATQAWPDVLLVAGFCGQAASGGSGYNGAAVHSTYQLS